LERVALPLIFCGCWWKLVSPQIARLQEGFNKADEEEDGGYYFGYGCLLVTTGPKLPVAAAFTDQKQVDQETARRVTQDALAVVDPIWMLGDAAFDMLEWHDDLIEADVVAIAPYNERNTDDPYDIEYRIDQQIKEHSETVRVWSKQLEETYEQQSQVERTIGACKDCGSKRRAFEAASVSNPMSSSHSVYAS
jgi:hypothetical protein